jgi:drug/metabolite transporter (DMT)-like permease
MVMGAGRKPILLALAAAGLFGVSIPLAKIMLADLAPQVLAALLYLGSGAGLVAWIALRPGRLVHEASFDRSNLPFLCGAIFFGGVLAPVLLLIGLQKTASSTASLLANLEGVFTTLLAWLIFREQLDRRIVYGMLAIFAAATVLAWSGSAESGGVAGPAMIVFACVCWGLDNNLSQRISAKDPQRIAALKGLAAGSVNGVIAIVLNQPLANLRAVSAALIIGFFSYGLSLVLFIRALRELGTARTGNYFSTAPFIGAGLSVLLLHEPFTPRLALAGALMSLGVWLHLSEKHEHLHVHADEIHEHSHIHDEHHQHEHDANDPPGEPHSHPHRHKQLEHSHPHYPDIHHRHIH